MKHLEKKDPHTVHRYDELCAVKYGVSLKLTGESSIGKPYRAQAFNIHGVCIRNDNELWVREELERMGAKIVQEFKMEKTV